MASRRRVERFAAIIDEAGDTAAGDLAPLLRIAQTLQAVPVHGDIEPEFRSRLRARLIAMSTVHLPTQPGTGEPAVRPAVGPDRRRVSGRSVLLGGALACVVGVPAVGAASMNAVSGDALYGIKRATESVQVRLATGDADRGRRHLALARTRLGEAREVRGDERALTATISAMDHATVQGARLLTAVAVSKQDRAPLDSIDEFVAVQSPALGSLVQSLPAGTSRDRAVESLVLVERLQARSTGLRVAMVCPASPPATDDLGPQPVGCAGTGPIPGGAEPGAGPRNNSPGTGLGDSPEPGAAGNGGNGGAAGGTPGGLGTGGAAAGVPPQAAGAPGAAGGAVDDLVGSPGGTVSNPPVPAPVPVPTLPVPVPNLPVPVPSLPVPVPSLPVPVPSLPVPRPTLPVPPPTLPVPIPPVPIPPVPIPPVPIPPVPIPPVPIPTVPIPTVPIPTVPVPAPTPPVPLPTLPSAPLPGGSPLPAVPTVPSAPPVAPLPGTK